MPINAHIYIYGFTSKHLQLLLCASCILKNRLESHARINKHMAINKDSGNIIYNLNQATPSKINEWLKRTMKMKTIKKSIKSIQKSMNVVEK